MLLSLGTPFKDTNSKITFFFVYFQMLKPEYQETVTFKIDYIKAILLFSCLTNAFNIPCNINLTVNESYINKTI